VPQPLLTKVLQPRFEAAIRKEARDGEEVEQIADLMAILPAAHWFLLADIGMSPSTYNYLQLL
jgi:hypothetical protein